MGSMNTECLACLQFTMDEQCVEHCPLRTKYNPVTYENEPNPDFRFSYGSRCLEQCPENVLEDGDNCVLECGPNTMEEGNKCIPCDGPCPKRCEGLEDNEILYAHHFDDERFKNCTTITNNIIIGSTSFEGDPWEGYEPLSVDMLEVFSTVKVITGFLSVQSNHNSFRDLSMFRNLEEINGRRLYGIEGLPVYSIYIASHSLEELSLTSLQKVKNGLILIERNPELCYVQEPMWEPLIRAESQTILVENNRPAQDCIADGDVCHLQCKDIGCWGPGPDQCAECENAQLGTTCVADCDIFEGQFVLNEGSDDIPMMCEYCDPECANTCDGPGPSNCEKCKNVKDGPFCRSKCPEAKYPDKNDECQLCHPNCKEGCTGSGYNLGDKGCNKCQHLVRLGAGGSLECMPANVTDCKQDEWYDRISERSENLLAGYSVCKQCDDQCFGCDGDGPSKCTKCRNFELISECVEECGPNRFPDAANLCQNCHEQCQKGCVNGTTEYDCNQCHNYEVIVDKDLTFCANECPIDYPYIQGINNCVSNCSANQFIGAGNICKACHSECKGGCYDDLRTTCKGCLHFEYEGGCQKKCPSTTKPDTKNVCMRDKTTGATRPK